MLATGFVLAYVAYDRFGPDLDLAARLYDRLGWSRVDERRLALVVYGLLPELEHLDAGPVVEGEPLELTENGRVASGRPRHNAEHLREDGVADPTDEQVRRALADLEKSVREVRSTGDGRYYRR